MKKTIITLMVLFAMQTFISAQCGINKKEYLKNCEGIYLIHLEIKSDQEKKVAFVLNKGTKYAFYLLNPSKNFPSLKIAEKGEAPLSIESDFNKENNYKVFEFTPDVSSTYIFKFDFGTDKDACVLFALYFREKLY